jgi:hypothetical protein
LTDSIDVGNTLSEQRHQYQYTGTSWAINKSSSFEGEAYKTMLIQDGYAFDDYSQFIVRINRNNDGVRLLRTYDYAYKDQTASVYVNDTFVGKWSFPGANPVSAFRDDYFSIPAKFTRGRDSLQIKIVNADSIWTELYYKVFTVVKPVNPPTAIHHADLNHPVQVFPNPATTELNIVMQKLLPDAIIYLVDVKGRQVLSSVMNDKHEMIPLSFLASGTYFYSIASGDKIVHAGKFIKTR